MKSPILTLKSPAKDLDRISPHTINMISSRQVIRIKNGGKHFNQHGILSRDCKPKINLQMSSSFLELKS